MTSLGNRNFIYRISGLKTFTFLILQFVSFFFSTDIYSQLQNAQGSKINSEFYSLLFTQDTITANNQGIIKLPGDYKKLRPNDDLLLISFENVFNVSNSNTDGKIIFENGLTDEGMVLINDQFLNDWKVTEGDLPSYEQIIPKEFLKSGLNSVKILAISYSESGYINGDISIQQGGQEIDLSDDWNYNIYTENRNNLTITPTQIIPIDMIYDFSFSEYLSQNFNDSNWPNTNFPVSIEELYDNNQLDGAFWFRKNLSLEELPETDMYFKVIEGIDDHDKLFLNEKLIGHTNCYNCPRSYKIPKEYFRKNNVFSLLVVDNYGPGGIRGNITLEGKDTSIDISNNWKYRKIFDLQILVTIKEFSNKISFFDNDEVSIFNLGGWKLNFDNILIEDKIDPVIYVILVLILSSVLYMLYLRIVSSKKIDEKIDSTMNNVKKTNDFVFIRANRANHKIEIQNILIIEGKKDYVKLHLLEKSYLVRKNLKTFLNELPSSKFIRISKSVAVNIDQIKTIDKNMLFLKSDKYYIIGKKYYSQVKDLVS